MLAICRDTINTILILITFANRILSVSQYFAPFKSWRFFFTYTYTSQSIFSLLIEVKMLLSRELVMNCYVVSGVAGIMLTWMLRCAVRSICSFVRWSELASEDFTNYYCIDFDDPFFMFCAQKADRVRTILLQEFCGRFQLRKYCADSLITSAV